MQRVTGVYRDGQVYLDGLIDWPDGLRVSVSREVAVNDKDAESLGARYFNEIRQVWTPFAPRHRIIPFCTPVFPNPVAVVVGTNHSDFDPSNEEESRTIADKYASGDLAQNTFLRHNHKFAVGLRDWCSHVGIQIDESWIGTNRCAVQAGPDGIDNLKDSSHFANCQEKMDAILRRLLAELAPRNVILTGKYAAALFYPNATAPGTKFVDLTPRDEMLVAGISTRLIAIEHPSRKDLFRDKASRRLAEFFVR